jgi:asparagine synthase (glutamine-hydrolysing)
MFRYFAMLCCTSAEGLQQEFSSLRAAAELRLAGWNIASVGRSHMVLVKRTSRGATESYTLKHGGGCVLGRVFPRPSQAQSLAKVSFNEEESLKVVRSGGQLLTERYWGSYVAFLYDGSSESFHVVRDPTGTLPCYYMRYKGVEVLFSHIEDCVRVLPTTYSINSRFLSNWLMFSGLPTGETGISDVEDLPSNRRLSFRNSTAYRSQIWNVAEIAREPRFLVVERAASELRATVQETIDAWAACYEHIGLRLSGGLDSSIVAGCLARCPSRPRLTFLNLAIDIRFDQGRGQSPGVDKRAQDKIRSITGSGDERYFARLVAERWNIPLVERRRDITMNFARLYNAPLATTPALYFTALELDDIEIEMAKSLGIQTFLTGQAGDSVLHLTTQPFGAIDYAYLHGCRGLWPHLFASSRLSRQSLWCVGGKVVQHGLLRRPSQLARRYSSNSLLSDDLKQTVADSAFERIWTSLGTLLPPGKQDHASGMTGAGFHQYIFHSGNYLEHVDPLNSQPVWETMLRIPTYIALVGGISRGLARRAFADLLPDEIRTRQMKGSGDVFYQRLVQRNKALLRETLLNGYLAKEGYLDLGKLERYFNAEKSDLIVAPGQILRYFSAELWIQHWSRVTKNSEAVSFAGVPQQHRQMN